MRIRNGLVYKNGQFNKEDIYIKDGLISAVDPGDSDADINAGGCYVVPGFVDIHMHGAAGHDFCDADPAGVEAIAAYERSHGITSFCPTSMTFGEERLRDIFRTARDYQQMPHAARVAGINMEGPFIAPEKKGAQNGDYIMAPDVQMFRRLQAESGDLIKLITLAPELDGALDFIKELHDEVTISIGHTCADYDISIQAFKAGASHVTHLCNAMPPLSHRAPGVIGAAADAPEVYVEVICDGIHIHPSMIRRIYDIFGDDRIVLISDSMEATGMPDGTYQLGGQKVNKKGSKATLDDGIIAGSVSNLYDCFRNAVDFGIPLESALKMVTENPAASIGMADQIGILEPGAYADVILLDEKLNLVSNKGC